MKRYKRISNLLGLGPHRRTHRFQSRALHLHVPAGAQERMDGQQATQGPAEAGVMKKPWAHFPPELFNHRDYLCQPYHAVDYEGWTPVAFRTHADLLAAELIHFKSKLDSAEGRIQGILEMRPYVTKREHL